MLVLILCFRDIYLGNMYLDMKQIIRLTESDLRNIISDSVYHILKSKQNLDEGWKNWAMAGALGTASIFGNPQTANAQDDMYFNHNKTTKVKKDEKGFSNSNLQRHMDKIADLEDWGNQLHSASERNTFWFNLTDSLKGFRSDDGKIMFVYANNKFTMHNKNLTFSLPLDDNGGISPAISFFATIAQKVASWRKICDAKNVHDLTKEMNLSFNADVARIANSMHLVFITRGNKVGVNIVKYIGDEPSGALFIAIEDLQRIIKLLQGIDTNSISQKENNYNGVYDMLQ